MMEAKNARRTKYAGFDDSFKYDRRLFAADVRVSAVYCDALFHAGILTRIEAERIKNGLQTILKRADFYEDYFDAPDAPDVHTFIEDRLVQLVGEAGAKINVGRSRYDQSITAFRLWLRGEIEAISKTAGRLQKTLIETGERQKTAVFPAFAHRRRAQPILWAHWCLAYYEMLARDRERLEEIWRRVNISPLGAADLTGTAFEIDREEAAAALRFEGVSANSLDAATDADFALETVNCFSLLAIHLSRLAEDLMNYSAPEFGLIEFADEPATIGLERSETQEILETARGRTANFGGYQTTLFSLMKNLSLGIHRDLQEIKKTIFGAVDTINFCLQTILTIAENVKLDEEKSLAAVNRDYLNAAELSDYLIQRNVPVKAARETVSRIVAHAARQNAKIEELNLSELQKFSENINADVFRALSLEQSLATKNQFGGTAPETVHEALAQAKENLEREGN